jgi:small subunit ribosomal protein S17e
LNKSYTESGNQRKKDKIPLFFSYDVDRVKKMANELLERYPDKFTSDFGENKETIHNFAIVRSKELRNKIAGYITKSINRNLAQQNASISYTDETGEVREENTE